LKTSQEDFSGRFLRGFFLLLHADETTLGANPLAALVEDSLLLFHGGFALGAGHGRSTGEVQEV
jgi:hypothetical protein